ncbi:MAG: hypothetical protein A2054_00940 [Deltaproteobacteria bacterium GWA2_55_10]|nr:MAG: hypothetical protein A2054_00940 [Deltaproteobacteria bacterium GWA2_55_10]
MDRTLLVLGAGSDQVFLMKTARSMGLRVIAVDMNPRARGFAFADEYAPVSTGDFDGIVSFAEHCALRGHRISGVMTMGSDIPEMVASVAARFGLPGIALESASLAKDKYAMKARFLEKEIPVPQFRKIFTPEELRLTVRELGLPLVLKPVDSSGSRGVFLLERHSDIEPLFEKSKPYSRSGALLAEEYLKGLQISTETIMSRSKGVTPGFADRNYDDLGRFLPQIMENGGWVPSSLNEREREEVEALVERASLALGITDGVTKGDVVMTAEGPKIIEMAARLSGGDFCESLVPLSAGVNYVKAAVSIALGEEPDLSGLRPKFSKAVVNRYFFPPPGRLISIEGAEEIRRHDWLKKLEFWYSPGDLIPPALSHAHRFGVFVAVADTREEADERARLVYETVRIRTEPTGTDYAKAS